MARQLSEGDLTPVKWRKLIAEKTGLGERRVKMVMDAMVDIGIEHLQQGHIIFWNGLFSVESWIAKPVSRNLAALKPGQKVGVTNPEEIERKIYHFPPRRCIKIFPQKSLRKKIAESTPPDAQPTREPVLNWSRRQRLDKLKAEEEARLQQTTEGQEVAE
jgi:hypothetical protein